jgi:hypothetical protein
LGRIKEKRPEKSIQLAGLRGVGKTVLLNELERLAATAGYRTEPLEARVDKFHRFPQRPAPFDRPRLAT